MCFTISVSIDRQPQKDINQSKSLTVNNDADDLSAQHLHHSADNERKQRRNNLSDSTELSSSIESLNEDQHKQQVRIKHQTFQLNLYHIYVIYSNQIPFHNNVFSYQTIASTHIITVNDTSFTITITTALRRITIETVSH